MINIILIAEKSDFFLSDIKQISTSLRQRMDCCIRGGNQHAYYVHLGCPGLISPQVHSFLLPCRAGLCRLHFPGFTSASLQLGAANGRHCWKLQGDIRVGEGAVQKERRKMECFSSSCSSSWGSSLVGAMPSLWFQLLVNSPAKILPSCGCDSGSCPLTTVPLFFVSPA